MRRGLTGTGEPRGDKESESLTLRIRSDCRSFPFPTPVAAAPLPVCAAVATALDITAPPPSPTSSAPTPAAIAPAMPSTVLLIDDSVDVRELRDVVLPGVDGLERGVPPRDEGGVLLPRGRGVPRGVPRRSPAPPKNQTEFSQSSKPANAVMKIIFVVFRTIAKPEIVTDASMRMGSSLATSALLTRMATCGTFSTSTVSTVSHAKDLRGKPLNRPVI